MKSKSEPKAAAKDRALVITFVACCIVGIIGSMIYHDQPIISLLFRPGIIVALCLIWGFYLGVTYKG